LAEEEAAPEVCRPHTPWRVQVGAAHLAAAPTSFCRRLFIARNSNDVLRGDDVASVDTKIFRDEVFRADVL
jgi:hypothetical protein